MSVPYSDAWPYQIEATNALLKGQKWDPIAYAPNEESAKEILSIYTREWGSAGLLWRIAKRTVKGIRIR